MSSNLAVTFTLLENGLDFILRALEYLEGEPTKRDLKYAVLHLHSGIELILKERLRREHWSLIFEKPEDATKEKYETGDFFSVYWNTCLNRLSGICGIEISKQDLNALNKLKNKRNRMEHFGIVDNVSAVKASTVPVLNFAIDFITSEIGQETMIDNEQKLLNQIRESLSGFADFVNKRMRKIKPDLESFEGSVVTCPRCSQDTWIIDAELKCLFCGHQQLELEPAINEFVENVLGIDWHSIAKGDDWPVYQCPSCGMETLVDVGSNQRLEKPRFICFSCGNHWPWGELEFCESCGQPYEPNGMAVCDECFDWSLKRND
jgi:hypothetical protein